MISVDGHTARQMKHAYSCDIQICCPSVKMLIGGLHHVVDISATGHHI